MFKKTYPHSIVTMKFYFIYLFLSNLSFLVLKGILKMWAGPTQAEFLRVTDLNVNEIVM